MENSTKKVLICVNCKEYWIIPVPENKCICGCKTFQETHPDNEKVAINYYEPDNGDIVTFLKNRIKQLNTADKLFCRDRWDYSKSAQERAIYREESNKATFARQELEQVIKFHEKNNRKSNCNHPAVGIVTSNNGTKFCMTCNNFIENQNDNQKTA